jgi:hypothetical protein
MSKKASVERFARLAAGGSLTLMAAVSRGSTPALSVPTASAHHTPAHYPTSGLRKDLAAIGGDFRKAIAAYKWEGV